MDTNYYKDYYILERNHWWFTVRSAILQDTLKKHSDGKSLQILNVGIATGASTEALMKMGQVTSIEYDKTCCEFVRNKLNIDVINASATDLPFPADSYDIVCCYDVIEHIENDSLAIEELIRVCKKNGLIHITVPAYQFLWSDHDVINHHCRRYTMTNLSEKLKNKNANFLYKTYFNSILFLPIACVRLVTNLVQAIISKKDHVSKSDFQGFIGSQSLSNRFFYSIFNSERKLLNLGMRFKFGLSIQVLLKKVELERRYY